MASLRDVVSRLPIRPGTYVSSQCGQQCPSSSWPWWAWLILSLGIVLILAAMGVGIFFCMRSYSNYEERMKAQKFGGVPPATGGAAAGPEDESNA